MSSSNFEKVDLVVIGGGPAGYVAAIRAAQLGLKTVCIEKSPALGGTCLNVGCIPSKALLDSSEHYSLAKHKFQKHGIQFEKMTLDLAQMMKRKDDVVRQLTQGVAGLFKKNKIEWVQGHGKLAGKNGKETQVTAETAQGARAFEARFVLLATGSAPAELPFLKFDGKRVVSSTEALALPQVPNRLLVVGGGVIGLELGSVWARLGAKVQVVEFQDRILPTMDHALGTELQRALTKQGMEFFLGHKCLGAQETASGMKVQIESVKEAQKAELEADVILVATGRKPFSDKLGLDSVGITLNKLGQIEPNSHFETSSPGVYAVGDLIPGPMLAHKAEEEGIAAVEIMAGQAGHVNYGAIPGVVYTWPEFAAVGDTEEQLKAKGVAYKAGSFPFLANGRAKAMDEVEGQVKVLADAKTDRVLGVHIVGPRASDMIAEAVAVMEFGGSAEDIARTCHAHPTLAEVMKEAAMDVAKRRIHL